MNWPVLIVFGVLALLLMIFLVVRNQKDEKKVEEDLKNDYRKPKAEERDINIDEIMK